MKFEKIALSVPNIYLPEPGVDLAKWAVIACDQYTSDQDYWDKVRRLVGESPSTLQLIFPEIDLEKPDSEGTIRQINLAMERYLAQGVLREQGEGFLLVDRRTTEVPSRKGLIVALDLDRYEYHAGSDSLIRATEGTILDRLPPRIRVREKAPIELPHIMVLIDDPARTVIEPLFDEGLETAYDFPLMMNGGHIKGYRVENEKHIRQVADALERLADHEAFQKRYDVEDKAVVLYAVGDGNHSFATAKAIWDKIKENAADKKTIENHPARYCLVELVNLHDPGLEFEAIHRVLFGPGLDRVIDGMRAFFAPLGGKVEIETFAGNSMPAGVFDGRKEGEHIVPFVAEGVCGIFKIVHSGYHFVIAALQAFLDHFLANARDVRLDYIHGSEAVSALGAKKGNVGFFLPAISKNDLFKTIILDGALPRKSFSLGHADEKRFYLECRKII